MGVRGKKDTHFETKVNLCSRCSNAANGVQGTVNIIYGCSVFGEKKRPTLKQRSICVGGVRRVPEHRERCSMTCEHNKWVFGVQGKKETHFETKVNL